MVNNESQRSYDESFLPGVHVENWSPRFLYHGIIICEWTGRSFSRIFNMHLLVKHCLIDCRKDYWGYDLGQQLFYFNHPYLHQYF